MPRVLSLLSASTEIVHRLGCSHLLVGRSHGCDDPPLAAVLPVATAPKVDPIASSKELDEAVRAQAATGGPIYQINNELVTSAKPDIILTQEQCRICAVTPEDVASACVALPKVRLVTIMPVTLGDVFGDIGEIARALGVPERGERLVRTLRARFAMVEATVKELARPARPRVAHLEWLAPLMGSGYWIAECVTYAGGEMVHGTAGGHSTTIERTSLLENADVIVIAPCGFSIERTHAELAELGLLQSEAWQRLPAVRAGAVAVADGNLYFNRSSCGVLETAEIVAEASHGDDLRGHWGHHGKRWVRLSELEAFCTREGAPPTTKRVVLADDQPAPPPPAKAPKLADAGRPRERRSASQHVWAQLAQLRAGGYGEAFAFNSLANRARLGDAAKFETIVKGNASFRTLCDATTAVEVVAVEGEAEAAKAALIRVVARPPGAEEMRFAFDLSRAEADLVWETDGVRIEC